MLFEGLVEKLGVEAGLQELGDSGKTKVYNFEE